VIREVYPLPPCVVHEGRNGNAELPGGVGDRARSAGTEQLHGESHVDVLPPSLSPGATFFEPPMNALGDALTVVLPLHLRERQHKRVEEAAALLS
jgi:hypothetical protein